MNKVNFDDLVLFESKYLKKSYPIVNINKYSVARCI